MRERNLCRHITVAVPITVPVAIAVTIPIAIAIAVTISVAVPAFIVAADTASQHACTPDCKRSDKLTTTGMLWSIRHTL
jgi:hypothetical protein